jgi:cytochrome c556
MDALKTLGKTSAMVVSLIALGGAVALAASPQDIVKARQADMKSFGADSKAISDYVKGAGDKAAAIKAAGDISDTATKLTKMWPKGTSSADLPGVSGAKPIAFTDGAKFTDNFVSMSQGAQKLGDTIKNGSTDEVKAAFMAFSKTNCGGCHMTYRESLQH